MSKGYETGVMQGEPILLTTFTEQFQMNEAPAALAEMAAILESSSMPLYMLDDVRRLRVTFSDLVSGLALSTRGDLGVATHRNVRKIVIITNNEILKLGSNALKQAQYGGRSVEVYTTLEAALEAIRGELQSATAA